MRYQLNRRNRLGASLLEVAIGAALLSLILIPALRLMGHSSSKVTECQRQDVLLFEAQRALEQKKIELATQTGFDAAVSGGLRATDVLSTDNGLTSVRQLVTLDLDRSISVVSNPDTHLLTITATAYHDANHNGRLDESEASETLRTQWCRPL